MATKEEPQISTITAERLLGRRLNDVETKYAPTILYVKGSIPSPLSKPRAFTSVRFLGLSNSCRVNHHNLC
jgi:hypothetical protein